MTTLYLVRHAVTADTGVRLTGWTPGVHLSENGVAQAETMAGHLKSVQFRGLYSSPIDRCLETARIIGRQLGMPVSVRKGLGEIQFGKWTNRSFRSLTRTKLWGKVQRVPSAARFPDGESFREVQSRALAEVDRIADDHPRSRVCVVSHADVIKLITAHFLGMHLDLFQRIVISPASVTVISGIGDVPHVVTVNALPAHQAAAR